MINLKKEKNLVLELDVSGLPPAQKRLIRYINAAILHTITTNDEAEYFNGTSEAMRMLTALISQAHFAQNGAGQSSIPYSVQALEFCIESITEDISQRKVSVFDN